MRSSLLYGVLLYGVAAASTFAAAPPAMSLLPAPGLGDLAATVADDFIEAKRSKRKGRPPGWNRGRKTGWGRSNVPPGQRKR